MSSLEACVRTAHFIITLLSSAYLLAWPLFWSEYNFDLKCNTRKWTLSKILTQPNFESLPNIEINYLDLYDLLVYPSGGAV